MEILGIYLNKMHRLYSYKALQKEQNQHHQLRTLQQMFFQGFNVYTGGVSLRRDQFSKETSFGGLAFLFYALCHSFKGKNCNKHYVNRG